MIWKLDQLGRSLRHLVNTVGELTARGIGLKVLTGEGAMIDMFGIFAAFAEFERELVVERTRAGIAAAQARGKHCGRPSVMTPEKIHLLQKAMDKRETVVLYLVTEIGKSKATAYR